MKLGPVIDKMIKNTDKNTFERELKPLLTITIAGGEPDEEDEEADPLRTEGITEKFRKGE